MYYQKSRSILFHFIVILLIFQFKTVFADSYEDDNTIATANKIYVFSPTKQKHSFHQKDDVDWVKFYAIKDNPYAYVVKASNLHEQLDVILEIYNENGEQQGDSIDFGWKGEEEQISFSPPADGYYYVKISSFEEQTYYGEDVTYELSVYHETAEFFGMLKGVIVDSQTGLHIPHPKITSSGALGIAEIGDENGQFIMFHPAGTYDFNISAENYENQTVKVTVTEDLITPTEVDAINLAFSSTVLNSINQLFDWAEHSYQNYFSPAGQNTYDLSGYKVRFYPSSNTYIGVKGNDVFVYGDIFGGLLKVGSFDELLSNIE